MEKKYNIMIIDDNVTNLSVAKQVLTGEYNVIPVTSGEKALALLERIHPDLILLDIEMPGLNGFETIKFLKANNEIKDIPIIFLTSLDDQGNELEGLQLGAMDYITKPFSASLLLKRIKIHIDLFNYRHNLEKIVREKTEIIKELQYAIIHTITDLVERRDGSTGGHVMRTQAFVKAMIDALISEGCYQETLLKMDCDMVADATPLHDVGKIGIPDQILLKPGKLSDEEFNIMKQHVEIGEAALRKALDLTRDKEFLEYALVLAAFHHEKWDGTGYPNGLAGQDIPLLGRIMAIADVYDALVAKRPYKEPFSHNKAVEILRNSAGSHFDPILIEVFLKIENVFYEISQKIYD